uniref:Putative retroelement pol polyprotein n=1 Tax=Albugo laibachii Nc14 TaxID=890382 RepID=F0WZ75_9STRA|nr:putative retroelement pol polyprotein [Albugo laibachii Nc14]|eukprot:CCA26791.1 putative retroelement pol polyprotein [Albugo laibachii Nc14]
MWAEENRLQEESKCTYVEKAFTCSNISHRGWILDNGASSHMCPFQVEFTDIRFLQKTVLISVANRAQVEAKEIGTIRVILTNSRPIPFEDILYVPRVDRTLMSITALESKSLKISFEESSCRIEDEEVLIVEISRKRKLSILERKTAEVSNIAGQLNEPVPSVTVDIWHARLWHLHLGKLKQMDTCVNGLILKKMSNNDYEDEICEGCAYGKSSVKAFRKSDFGTTKTKSLLEVFHSDVMGTSIIYITLYSDDMLVGAKTSEQIEAIQKELSNRFKIKDLGNARFVLGIEVIYDRKGRKLKISQESNIRRMIERFGRQNAKPVVQVHGSPLYIHTVYAPVDPTARKPFFDHLTTGSFEANASHIVCGDLNTTLCSYLDCSSGVYRHEPSRLSCLEWLSNVGVVDAWGQQHPEERNSSYESLFDTGDHLAHILKFASPSQLQGRGYWKCPFSLFGYPVIREAIEVEAELILAKLRGSSCPGKVWERWKKHMKHSLQQMQKKIRRQEAELVRAQSELEQATSAY